MSRRRSTAPTARRSHLPGQRGLPTLNLAVASVLLALGGVAGVAAPAHAAVDTVTGTIAVGSNPFGVALSPDGATAYVTNSGSGTVSVIETASGTVTDTIAVDATPTGVAMSPDGATVYVTHTTGFGTVSVIETASGTVTDTIAVGSTPFEVAVSPDGATAYVTNSGSGTVSVIETASGTVTDTIAVGVQTFGVAVSPDGATAYVTNTGSGTVSVIETASGTVTDTITVGSTPYGVALSPDGATAYVTSRSSATVSVIETASGTVTDTIMVGSEPYEVAVSPDGATAYVTNSGSDTMSVIETASGTVTDTITVDSTPSGVAVSPDSATAYVTNYGSGTVSVLTASSTAPGVPTGLTPTPGNGQVGLGWTVPASDGGSPITDYVVEYKVSSSGTWLTFADGTSMATSAVVTGLTNGTAYDFRVLAVNAVGTSAPSAVVTATPVAPIVVGPPGAPTGVSATPGDASAVVTWTVPASDGGSPITSYVITPINDTNPDALLVPITVTGATTTATITALTNGDTYRFVVTAVNSSGTGPSSDPSNAITPSTGDQSVPVPVLVLDRTELAPGQAFTATATNLPPNTLHTFVLNSTPVVLGSAVSSAAGVIVFSSHVPADTPAGTHTLSIYSGGAATATGADAIAIATASFTVTVTSLATTGSDIGRPLALGGLLVAAGLGMVVLSTRRGAAQKSRPGARAW